LFCPTLHVSEKYYFKDISILFWYIGQLMNSPIQAFLLHCVSESNSYVREGAADAEAKSALSYD